MPQLGYDVQLRLCNPPQDGIVPLGRRKRNDDAQIDLYQFQCGTDAAMQLRLKQRQYHVLPVFGGATLEPAPFGAFSLDGFLRPVLASLRTNCSAITRVGRTGFNMQQ